MEKAPEAESTPSVDPVVAPSPSTAPKAIAQAPAQPKTNESQKSKAKKSTQPTARAAQQPKAKKAIHPAARRARTARAKLGRITLSLKPQRATYELTDRPRVKAVALSTSGKKMTPPSTLKWSMDPASFARIDKKGRIRFKRVGRGTVKGCAGKVCGTLRVVAMPAADDFP